MTAFQQAVPGHGMTEIEQAIMDRHDAGAHASDIALALGLKPSRVRSVISLFGFREGETWEPGVRQGSRDLLVAIRALEARRG